MDLRPWGGGRISARDPKSPGWPAEGARTENEDSARKWAWDHLRYVRGEVKDREDGVVRDEPLGPKIEQYREHIWRNVELTTYRTRNTALNALLEHFKEKTPLRRITTDRLQAYFNELVDAGYEPSTLSITKQILGRFFRWAGAHDPTQGVELPVVVQADTFAWSLDEWREVRRAAKDVRHDVPLLLLLDIAVCTGGRINELLALRWEDINSRAGTVRFVRQFEPSYTTERHLKGKLARTALCLEELWTWGYDFKQRGAIVQANRRPISSGRITQPLHAAIDPLGLGGAGVGFHVCRRTYGALWLERGARMEELQRWLGHKSISTTEKAYAKFTSERAASVARERLYTLQKRKRRA